MIVETTKHLYGEIQSLVDGNQELEVENEKLKARINKLESIIKAMVEEACRLGVRSDAWDFQVKEYRHWDL